MTYSHYRIEIDMPETPQHPIVYFRKERKCKTAKGMERQHNRVVNETVDQWRQYSQQISRYTISRVPASEVA
jgi:hypothetical protein